MQSSTRALAALAFLAVAAGCAPQRDEVVYVEAPVTAEPVYTGKYK
jgi:hypothetical protein